MCEAVDRTQVSEELTASPNKDDLILPATVDSADEVNDEEQPTKWSAIRKRLVAFYLENEFLILVIVAILLARAYPPLGAIYLAPDITASWIAVMFIFIMAGLGLKTEEFSKAFRQVYFNVFVQCFNFGVVSAVVFGVSRLIAIAGIVNQNLADGMTIAASLPMTINMVLVFTKASGGDEAAAIFNAAFGNLVGVFLSPVLILGYLGVTGEVDLVSVFYKLAVRVLLPIVVGQILQKTSQVVVNFVNKYKQYFKQAQQYALVFIVYTVFCETFIEGSGSSVADIFIMIAFVFLSLVSLMVLAWYSLRLLFRDQPELRVMGLYGCTHKTVAMGVPLINAIYEGNPAIGLYTLPLLIWHTMQLIIGTFLSPRVMKFVKQERERLGLSEHSEEFSSVDMNGDLLASTKVDPMSKTEEGGLSHSPEDEKSDEDVNMAKRAVTNTGTPLIVATSIYSDFGTRYMEHPA